MKDTGMEDSDQSLLILLVTECVSKKNGYKLQQLELGENVKNGWEALILP